MVPAARAVALSGSSQAIAVGPAHYAGLAVIETGGLSPATVRVFNHPSMAAGTLVDAVDLPAGGSLARLYDRATWCDQGIWVELGGLGTVAGSVRIA